MVQKILLLILNIKKIIKLSIICNKNNFIHSVEVFDLKTKNYNYNTDVHDLKMIYQSLKKVNINNKLKYFNLLGAKSYKTKEIFK